MERKRNATNRELLNRLSLPWKRACAAGRDQQKVGELTIQGNTYLKSHREVFIMPALREEETVERSEELSRKAEMLLEEDESRKDLKEKRGIIKQSMYEGSKKLKHLVPKGKHQ